MNDPGLGDVIDDSEDKVRLTLQYEHRNNDEKQVKRHRHGRGKKTHETHPPRNTESAVRRQQKTHRTAGFRNEETRSVYQPTLWWFTSTAFPLFAGTFGPIASLFSVCALVQTWRVTEDGGDRVPDPPWLLAMNACSLALALIANVFLLFNFARRVRYSIAQPITITLWYLACILLVIPIGLSHRPSVDAAPPGTIYSQSYYYGLISCSLYFGISTLLLLSTLGSTIFHAYEPSFNVLTGPQRTLMLQTISFSLYLALGAGIFAGIENWSFADGLYWADYTLLTIGLGTDFPLTTTLGRMLLIPYAAFGITLIGLVVSSVRGLVLERAKTKVVRRHLGKEREKWKKNIEGRQQLALSRVSTMHTYSTETNPLHISQRWWERKKERDLMRLPQKLQKHVSDAGARLKDRGRWHRAEFELMRFIEQHTESTERYTALAGSFFIILIVWIGGALIFWNCEHKSQGWTFPQSFYFTYTTLLTIGYGDFYPNSAAGKPFFVVWSLISVPAMTVLISNMGDTVVKWVQDVTVWASRKTILPERDPDKNDKKSGSHISEKRSGGDEQEEEGGDNAKTSYPNNPPTDDTHFRAAHAGNEGGQEHEEGAGALQEDVEQLGEDVEEFEEEEGRQGSLAAQIAKEISILARDLGQKPPKKYTWEQWSKWLDMLGEKEGQEEDRSTPGEEGEEQGTVAAPVLVATDLDAQKEQESRQDASQISPGTPNHIDRNVGHFEYSQGNTSTPISGDSHDSGQKWHWTWLSDHGPLFSHLTETEWLIEKLCFRLEEVLEEEIKEAREDNGSQHIGHDRLGEDGG
ncbi:hypothetical protein D9613_000821 [Agrocybe pediades]|uniref:Potassium channel domain-containing protein n=1 Tax=Agrocybe pediades TaxID=84607 RepID=A0A8H4R0V5_9AGAR|nr:hypothetical protein D9613_000821 [Agrocybe pediades]